MIGDLVDTGVERLVDVRELPLSRRRGFSKTALGDALRHAGIEYVHVRALGNPKPNRERYWAGDLAGGAAVYHKHLNNGSRTALVEVRNCGLVHSLPRAQAPERCTSGRSHRSDALAVRSPPLRHERSPAVSGCYWLLMPQIVRLVLGDQPDAEDRVRHEAFVAECVRRILAPSTSAPTPRRRGRRSEPAPDVDHRPSQAVDAGVELRRTSMRTACVSALSELRGSRAGGLPSQRGGRPKRQSRKRLCDCDRLGPVRSRGLVKASHAAEHDRAVQSSRMSAGEVGSSAEVASRSFP
jgi:hypothetical protein